MADSDFAAGLQRPSSGCGVQGCLFGAVALFVLILVGVLVIAMFRFRVPPQGIPQPPGSMAPAAERSLAGALPGPATDDRVAATGPATGGVVHA